MQHFLTTTLCLYPSVSTLADTAATRTAAKSDALAFLSVSLRPPFLTSLFMVFVSSLFIHVNFTQAAAVICLPSGLPARGLQLLAATLRLQQPADPVDAAAAQDESQALSREKEGWLGIITGSALCRI